MRKKAQEKKHAMSLASSSSISSYSASNEPKLDSLPSKKPGEESFCDIGGPETSASMKNKSKEEEKKTENAMDDIWREIALSEENAISPAYECYSEEGRDFFCPQIVSPAWQYFADSLWNINNEECKMFPPLRDPIYSYYEEAEYLSG